MFEVVFILAVLLVCIDLAIRSPPYAINYFFLVFFTLAMLLKVVALGFVMHKYSYMRDPWNWLELFCVIIAFVSLDPSVQNLAFIRALRIFVILRSLRSAVNLQALISALYQSLKQMVDVLIVLLFMVAVFAIVGVEMFGGERMLITIEFFSHGNSKTGTFMQHCVLTTPDPFNASDSTPISYADYIHNSSHWAYDYNGIVMLCANDTSAQHCPENYTCLPDAGPNPNDGYTSFDNFGIAFLTTWQIITGNKTINY